MKKLVLLFVLAFSIIGNAQELELKNGNYIKRINTEIVPQINFIYDYVNVYFEKDLVDKYEWNDRQLTTMALSSIILSRVDIDNVDSFVFTDNLVLIADIDGDIMTVVKGKYLTNYGYFKPVTVTMYFDKSGMVQKDKDGLFRIITN